MLAQRIRARRKALDISQKRLAELSGIAQSSISRYEKGDDDITVGYLIRIAQALECSPLYLVEEEFSLVSSNLYSQSGISTQKLEALKEHLKECLALVEN